MLVSGLIAANVSWKAVFYIEGGVSSIWLILWIILSADTPQKALFITDDERKFIGESLNQGKSEIKHVSTSLYSFYRNTVTKQATNLKFMLSPNGIT